MNTTHIASLHKRYRKIHFMGIAGIMMSNLACVAKLCGFDVSGSDEHAYPPATTLLAQHQINWIEGHKAENLESPDLVVLGNHIRPDNPELQSAIVRQLEIVSYPQLVRMLYPEHTFIVPSGTHGKSTLTAMLGWILSEANSDPTVLIGAISRNYESSYRYGRGNLVVIEGDEYSSSCINETPKFFYYHPTHAIVTSAELDHVDIYPTIEKQLDIYNQFCKSIIPGGALLLCGDSSETALLIDSNIVSKVQTYGLNGKFNWQATAIKCLEGETHFNVIHNDSFIAEVSLVIPGVHNVQNSLAAIAIALNIGVPINEIQSALRSFLGTERRFEIKGNSSGIIVVDDYAHHPTAIRTTLATARFHYPHRRIWCVYEPHTYTRIQKLLPQFKNAFEDADEVIISEIYPAREKSLKGLVHSRDIVEVAQKQNPKISYVPTADEILVYLSENVQPNDLVIFMSVGRFAYISDKLVRYMEARNVNKKNS